MPFELPPPDGPPRIQREPAVKERIHRLYERIGRLDSEEIDVLRLIVREALVSSERRERLLERFQRGHLPIVVRTILDGFADGTLERSLHPLVVLSSVIALGALPPVIVRLVGGSVPDADGDGLMDLVSGRGVLFGKPRRADCPADDPDCCPAGDICFQ